MPPVAGPSYNLLKVAVNLGNSEALRSQLATSPQILSALKQVDQNGYSLLGHAAKKGHLAVCRVLLAANADPDLAGNADARPLVLARKFEHQEVARLLEVVLGVVPGANPDDPRADSPPVTYVDVDDEQLGGALSLGDLEWMVPPDIAQTEDGVREAAVREERNRDAAAPLPGDLLPTPMAILEGDDMADALSGGWYDWDEQFLDIDVILPEEHGARVGGDPPRYGQDEARSTPTENAAAQGVYPSGSRDAVTASGPERSGGAEPPPGGGRALVPAFPPAAASMPEVIYRSGHPATRGPPPAPGSPVGAPPPTGTSPHPLARAGGSDGADAAEPAPAPGRAPEPAASGGAVRPPAVVRPYGPPATPARQGAAESPVGGPAPRGTSAAPPATPVVAPDASARMSGAITAGARRNPLPQVTVGIPERLSGERLTPPKAVELHIDLAVIQGQLLVGLDLWLRRLGPVLAARAVAWLEGRATDFLRTANGTAPPVDSDVDDIDPEDMETEDLGAPSVNVWPTGRVPLATELGAPAALKDPGRWMRRLRDSHDGLAQVGLPLPPQALVRAAHEAQALQLTLIEYHQSSPRSGAGGASPGGSRHSELERALAAITPTGSLFSAWAELELSKRALALVRAAAQASGGGSPYADGVGGGTEATWPSVAGWFRDALPALYPYLLPGSGGDDEDQPEARVMHDRVQQLLRARLLLGSGRRPDPVGEGAIQGVPREQVVAAQNDACKALHVQLAQPVPAASDLSRPGVSR
jgi:hypothetical protein